MAGKRLRPETIFFGGGTPSALSTSQLQFLIEGLRVRVDFSSVREFTLEMNPATVSLEKAVALLELGVNRVSMGVQSWDDNLLKTLGRVHSSSQACRSYEILREAGVKNVNLDLIFGIPGQSAEQWRDSLRRTISLRPEHISAYCLTYEEDTEFFKRFQRGEIAPEESRDSEFFLMAMDELENAGFKQYEISNYAQPGRECLHNFAYWRGADYIGLGPSAFSTCNGIRWRNAANTREYIRRVEEKCELHDFHEVMEEETRRVERLAFSLRTSEGISIQDAPETKTSLLQAHGLVFRENSKLHLTQTGKLLADEIAAELI